MFMPACVKSKQEIQQLSQTTCSLFTHAAINIPTWRGPFRLSPDCEPVMPSKSSRRAASRRAGATPKARAALSKSQALAQKGLSRNGYGPLGHSQKVREGDPRKYIFFVLVWGWSRKHKTPHEYCLELVFGADCPFKVDALPIWGSPR